MSGGGGPPHDDPDDDDPDDDPDDDGGLGDDFFTVDRILGRRARRVAGVVVVQYLVAWEGYRDRTWETAAAFVDPIPVREYVAAHGAADPTGRGWALAIEARSSRRVRQPNGQLAYKYKVRWEGDVYVFSTEFAAQLLRPEMATAFDGGGAAPPARPLQPALSSALHPYPASRPRSRALDS